MFHFVLFSFFFFFFLFLVFLFFCFFFVQVYRRVRRPVGQPSTRPTRCGGGCWCWRLSGKGGNAGGGGECSETCLAHLMIYGRYDRADRFLDLYDLYDLYDRYDRYDLARVSGSETYILHGLAHVFWG